LNSLSGILTQSLQFSIKGVGWTTEESTESNNLKYCLFVCFPPPVYCNSTFHRSHEQTNIIKIAIHCHSNEHGELYMMTEARRVLLL